MSFIELNLSLTIADIIRKHSKVDSVSKLPEYIHRYLSVGQKIGILNLI